MLSKELNFIPPLLKAGDGYVVLPFLKNILYKLPEKKKRQLIQSKKKEIIRVIQEMYAMGFAYINFTPENIIITEKDEFFCSGFEFLYKYETVPSTIDGAYEVAGLPANFTGDRPGALARASSFEKIWEPYIGKWEKNTKPAGINGSIFKNTVRLNTL